MTYDAYTQDTPTYLETFEFDTRKPVQQKKIRKMDLAFTIDDATEKHPSQMPGEVEDPMMNISLKTMKPASGIFLGRLKLGETGEDFHNLRIDFYKKGITPILEIKICNKNLSCKITNERTILRIIKLCNMSSPKFIKNQLK